VALALHLVGLVGRHVVAQIVEAELVVRPIGDVAGVGFLAVTRRHVLGAGLLAHGVERDCEGRVVLQHGDADAQPDQHAAVPLRVTLGQVVVDCDQVNAAALDSVEVHRHGRDQRLTFTGLQLGDFALVQDGRADELHVERALAEPTVDRLAHDGEGLGQQVIQRLAVLEALAKLIRLRA
jgi:hypothetical protein